MRLNRQGQYDDAGRALDGVRKRVAAYAGSDPELREIVAELRLEVPGLRGGDARDGAQAAVLRGEPAVAAAGCPTGRHAARADREGIASAARGARDTCRVWSRSRWPPRHSSVGRPRPTRRVELNGVTPVLAGWAYLGLAVHRLEGRYVRRDAGRRPGAPADRPRGARARRGRRRGPWRPRVAGDGVRRPAARPSCSSSPGDRPIVDGGRRAAPSSRRGIRAGRRRAADGLPRTRGDPRGGSWIRPLGAARPPPAAARRRGGPAHRVRDVHARRATGRAGRPHKHDTDDPPIESQLEELYLYRFARPQGFARPAGLHADGTLDETVTARDLDIVLVPRGYHPVAAAPDDDCYYLSVMAGPEPGVARHAGSRPRDRGGASR